jgi:hypothetical protein
MVTELKFMYDHLNEGGCIHYNSDNYEINARLVKPLRTKLLTRICTDNRYLTIDELKMSITIIDSYIMARSEDYRDFFPSVLRIDNNNNNFNNQLRLQWLNRFHKDMEKYIILSKHIKCIIQIYEKYDSVEFITVRRSDYQTIMQQNGYNTDNPSIVNMINNSSSSTNITLEQLNYLENDHIYQKELDRIQRANLSQSVTSHSIAHLREESFARHIVANETVLHHEELWLLEDKIYKDEIKKIDASKVSAAIKNSKKDAAKIESLKRKHHEDKLEQEEEESRLHSNKNSSRNTKRSNDQEDDDDEGYIHTQHQTKKRSNPPIKKDNKKKTPKQTLTGKHHLTEHEKKRLCEIFEQHYNEDFNSSLQGIRTATHAINKEAKVNTKSSSLTTRRQEDDEDGDDDDLSNTYESDSNLEEDDENDKIDRMRKEIEDDEQEEEANFNQHKRQSSSNSRSHPKPVNSRNPSAHKVSEVHYKKKK